MSLNISGKQMNVGEALTERIEGRIEEAVTKYFGHGYSGQVTLEKSGPWFECDCRIHLDSGAELTVTARGTEAGSAFDDAADKLEKRLRRYKRRLKDHHSNVEPKTNPAFYSVFETPTEEEVSEDFAPAIVAESTTVINTQTVAQAVVELDLTGKPVVVFRNSSNGETNVVYRRADGNIGWVDPSRSA